MSAILELFGHDTRSTKRKAWEDIISRQLCPFTKRRCYKVRKSQPGISIGTCSVGYGKECGPILICPNRFLERRQIFVDSLHLLTRHEPGNQLHLVPEVPVPGGSVDYFLVSVRNDKPVDFVGIEIQTLDTTGTVWPARERFLRDMGFACDTAATESRKPFGMNWKMTAKTILVQLHHKVDTFEHLSRHLVVVVQDCLFDYMKTEFSFSHLNQARAGDAMHFHTYGLERKGASYAIRLDGRMSTDSAGISTALGLQAKAKIDLDIILNNLERKISPATLFQPV
ncbi:MAG: hypothetical protein GX580_09715 [Candidatus Hydrogenedens sp.]|nr:hypothetical protein [Candidatus Hydrogenedentota bacterium]NLF57903.1 hypothetical protein [Candidatus Hydrogenedens sp.]